MAILPVFAANRRRPGAPLPPPPPPLPTGTLTVTPDAIEEGDDALLSWTSSNATGASIDNGIGSVALSGTQLVSPTTTTAYTLTLTGPGGAAARTVELIVSLPSSVFTMEDGISPLLLEDGSSYLLLE